MKLKSAGRCARQKGHAVLEVALLAPWIFLLFAGALDMGFYMRALIATQNAARVAAEYTSSHTSFMSDTTGACSYVLAEMSNISNVRGLSTCTDLPLKVQVSTVTGVDGASASQVSVTYQTSQMIPLPFLTGKYTVTRTVQMRSRDS